MTLQQADFRRRQFLHAGTSAWVASSLTSIFSSRTAGAQTTGPTTSRSPDHATSFGRAKRIIYLFLSGGPSQYETFDPKPEAPVEIRGSFKPISTNVPGIHLSELLPRTASIVDRLAIVRSFATDDPNHESGGYWVNTGRKYLGPDMRALAPSDWPTLGSIVKMLRPTASRPFSAVMLPEPIALRSFRA